MVWRQFAALSSATQYTMPPELGGNWEMMCLKTKLPLPALLCAEYSVKLIKKNIVGLVAFSKCLAKCEKYVKINNPIRLTSVLS